MKIGRLVRSRVELAAELVGLAIGFLTFFFSPFGVLGFGLALVSVLLIVPHSRALLWWFWTRYLGMWPADKTTNHRELVLLSKRYSSKETNESPGLHAPLLVPKDFVGLRWLWKNWAFDELLVFGGATLSSKSQGGETKKVLSVNLRNGTHGVYNTEGKLFIIDQVIPSRDAVRGAAISVHEWMLTSGAERTLPQIDSLRLRWVSAGVVPIIRWKGRWWVALFFRDIRPVGQNLFNGGSQSAEEHLEPWLVMVREFCEELVVLSGRPEKEREVTQRRFSLDFIPSRKVYDMVVGHEFSRAHARLRIDDKVMINQSTTEEPIGVDYLPTPFEVQVIASDGATPTTLKNIIFSINSAEGGLECISLYHFSLGDDDYMIHGEISEWGFLLRRPLALFSLDWLRSVYEANGNSLGDVQGGPYLGGKLLGGPVPPEAFELFDADLDFMEARRRALERNEDSSNPKSDELRYLQGKGHLSTSSRAIFSALRDRKKGGVMFEVGEELIPFFVLCPVVWKTMEIAFARDVFRNLPK